MSSEFRVGGKDTEVSTSTEAEPPTPKTMILGYLKLDSQILC